METDVIIHIKPGYKKTPIGIIPEDWVVRKIINFAKVYDGTHQTPKYVEKGIPFYSVEHLTSNDFSNTKFISKEVFEKENKRVKLEKGDVLMTRIGDIGTAKYVDWNVNASFYVTLALFKKISPQISFKYFHFFIESNFFKRELYKKTLHVAFPNKINLGDIRICRAILPPLQEQKTIANCLSTWDSGIEKLTQLIQAKKQQKKGLMQQLLTGKKRLAGFNGEWKEVKLGDIAYITTGASNKQDAGDSFEYVFFDRSSDVLTSKIFLYDCEAIIVPGEGADFIPKYFVGKFDLHQRAYAIMDFKNVLGKYIFYYLMNDRKHLHRQAVGSTVKSLRLPYFKSMPMKTPPFEEQTAIANILQTADKEIELLEQKLSSFLQQKKGLMQALLTGEKRLMN